MNNCRPRSSLYFPLFLIGLGVIFLLDQFQVVSAQRAFDFFWPAVLIFAGAQWLASSSGARRVIGGLILLGGGLLLAENLGYLRFQVDKLWPLLLIAVGASLLLRHPRRPSAGGGFGPGGGWGRGGDASNPGAARSNGGADGGAQLDCVAMLGGVKRRVTAQNFRGGSLTAFMGGFEIDLTHAEIEAEEAVIDASALMGGGEIRVPEHWLIDLRAQAFLGGYSDETHQTPNGGNPKRLVIQGTAFLGGVVVKN